MRFIIRLLICSVALVVAAWLVPGVELGGGLGSTLFIALIFGVVNATIGSVLKLMTCPLVVLTLGLFTLVINGLMFQFSAWWARAFGLEFEVAGFWAAFFGALVVSIVSAMLSVFVGDEKREVGARSVSESSDRS